jgi:hypothetical protein
MTKLFLAAALFPAILGAAPSGSKLHDCCPSRVGCCPDSCCRPSDDCCKNVFKRKPCAPNKPCHHHDDAK